jgi:TldD protein
MKKLEHSKSLRHLNGLKNIVSALLQIVVMSTCLTPVFASDEDSLLKAMTDELARTQKELRTDEHPVPYFVSYGVKEVDEALSSSCLGSPPVIEHTRERLLFPIVRAGTYDTDSSYPLTSRPDFFAKMPLDDDYASNRHWIWLNTDTAYKFAVRALEWKKAYLASNNVTDRLPDRSAETPITSLNPVRHLSDENEKWMQNIQELSKVFTGYPTLEKSKVTLISRVINYWYVDSEGSKVRDSRSEFVVKLWASAQAPDGMPVSDIEIVASTEFSKLPDIEQLKSLAASLAKRVSDLRLAAKGKDYCGPVLFEGQAAAELFSQVMASNLGFAEEYVAEDWRNPLKDGLGRKILPAHMSVIDDPQAKDPQGTLLKGTYRFDDEGVPGSKLKLVENGALKTFCQSRIPTRHRDHSNGHSLGGHGVVSVLELSSSKPSTTEAMNQKITELAKDAGLDYILVVSRIKDTYVLTEYPSSETGKYRPYGTPSYSISPTAPVAVYKLYLSDGHRELIRGLEFRYISLRAFRDIQAVGNDAQPYLVEPGDYVTRALITPSYLVGELELTQETPEHSTPPLLPSPLESLATKKIGKMPLIQY